MSMSDAERHTGIIPAPFNRTDQRAITAVSRMSDGWSIEVEDASGVRLDYWLADTGCVPHVGDTVTFYGGVLGEPLHGIEINGCRVYYDAAD